MTGIDPNSFMNEMGNKTELKTLKNIDVVLSKGMSDRDIIEQAFISARTEAIKWVKSFEAKNSIFTTHAETAFRKFFNINEEDLK